MNKMLLLALFLLVLISSCDGDCHQPPCTGEENYQLQSFQVGDDREPFVQDSATSEGVQISIQQYDEEKDEYRSGFGATAVCGGCLPTLVSIVVDCDVHLGADTIPQGVSIYDMYNSWDRQFILVSSSDITFMKPKTLKSGLRTFKMKLEFSKPARIVEGTTTIFIPDSIGY